MIAVENFGTPEYELEFNLKSREGLVESKFWWLPYGSWWPEQYIL